jgi:hypothetical protein
MGGSGSSSRHSPGVYSRVPRVPPITASCSTSSSLEGIYEYVSE